MENNKGSTYKGILNTGETNYGGTAVMEPAVQGLDVAQLDTWDRDQYQLAFDHLDAFPPDVAARIQATAKERGISSFGVT